MRRLVPLLALAVALSAACGSGDESASTSSRMLPVASSVEAPTTTAKAGPYEPIQVPLASRAWLNRSDGALVVESCQEVDAYLAQGHTLAELVEHRSYACGPTVT